MQKKAENELRSPRFGLRGICINIVKMSIYIQHYLLQSLDVIVLRSTSAPGVTLSVPMI